MSDDNGSASPSPPVAIMTKFDLADIHEVSLDILSRLEESGVELNLATVGLALSFGRALAPKILEPEEEVQFIRSLMEYGQMYFCSGRAN